MIYFAVHAAVAAPLAPDPFAGVSVATTAAASNDAWPARYLGDNVGLRRELLSEFAVGEKEAASSRQSLGFEALKKFSSETATFAGVDFQGRIVRRDRFVSVQNDMEGMNRPGWRFEYHNAYLDLYNVLDPLLTDDRRAAALGSFNFRAGRFYVPFGLNAQTDTHATILQLSNEENFGFERDWHAGFWGAASGDLDYSVNYLAGSGYDLKYRGQAGLGAARLSLANRFSYEYGMEGGLSFLSGERLSPSITVVQTRRGGLDGRWRRPIPTGLFTASSELSVGRDDAANILAQLYQAEYLHSSRRWGFSSQYRRFWRGDVGTMDSVIGEATWYLRNDVGNANLHWFKFNVERKLRTVEGRTDTIAAMQYYRYW